MQQTAPPPGQWSIGGQPTFELYQLGTYSTSGTNYSGPYLGFTNVNPYGLAFASNVAKLYATARTRYVYPADPIALTVGTPIDLGDSGAFPYRIRWNPYDGLLVSSTLSYMTLFSLTGDDIDEGPSRFADEVGNILQQHHKNQPQTKGVATFNGWS